MILSRVGRHARYGESNAAATLIRKFSHTQKHTQLAGAERSRGRDGNPRKKSAIAENRRIRFSKSDAKERELPGCTALTQGFQKRERKKKKKHLSSLLARTRPRTSRVSRRDHESQECYYPSRNRSASFQGSPLGK